MKVLRKRYLPEGHSGSMTPDDFPAIMSIQDSRLIGVELGPGSEIDNALAITPNGAFVLTHGSPVFLPQGAPVTIQPWQRVCPIGDEATDLTYGGNPLNALDGAPIIEILVHHCDDPAPQIGRIPAPIVRQYAATGVSIAGSLEIVAAFPLFGRRVGTLKIENATADTGAVRLYGYTPKQDAKADLGYGGQALGFGFNAQIALGAAETAIGASSLVTLTIDSEKHDVILLGARSTGAVEIDLYLHWEAGE